MPTDDENDCFKLVPVLRNVFIFFFKLKNVCVLRKAFILKKLKSRLFFNEIQLILYQSIALEIFYISSFESETIRLKVLA